ncbi:MAG: GAF domain-containing protein [Armatimonadetes bacterium]|nr:GAF domain-containing protein [Armatimonadota bacterium]
MSERRREYRLSKVLAAQLLGEKPENVFIIDISQSGLRATSHCRLEEDLDLPLRISLSDSEGSIEVVARIVWQRELSLLSMFQMGMRFVEMGPSHAETLDRFILAERARREQVARAGEGVAGLRNLSYETSSRLSTLSEIHRLLHAATSLEEVLQRLLDIMIQATGAQRGFVMLDRGGPLPEVAVVGGTQPKGSDEGGFLFSRSVVEQVLRRGDSILSLDAGRDSGLEGSESLKFLKTRFVLCVPLKSGKSCFGLIYVDSTLGGASFGQSDLELAKLIATIGAAAAERVQLAPSLGAALHWNCVVWLAGLSARRLVEATPSDSGLHDLCQLLEEAPVSRSAGYLLRRCVGQVAPVLRALGQEVTLELQEDLIALEVEVELHGLVLASLLWLAFLSDTRGPLSIAADHTQGQQLWIQMSHPEIRHQPLPLFPVQVSPGREGGAIISWWAEQHGGSMQAEGNRLTLTWPVSRIRPEFSAEKSQRPERLDL